MTSPGRARAIIASFSEYLLVLPVLASLVWVVHHYLTRHYLPQPFVFDVNDTFMDWFNTAFYAHQDGAFDVWRTVYPPLSFVFLRVFSLSGCYAEPFIARDCDWLSIVTLLVGYVANCVVAAWVFWRNDRRTALPRGLAFAFGLPLLFALERGNLLIFGMIPFMLVYGGMLKSRWSRALSIAITINFKPYLVVPSLALAIRRDWRGLELACVATVALYLVTLGQFGSGTPQEIISNTLNFANYVGSQGWQQTYLSTSYSTLMMLVDSPLPILKYLRSGIIEMALWVLPMLIHSAQLAALVGLGAAWVQPRAIPLARNVALLVGAHLATQSPGGYAFMLITFLVFLEDGRRPGQLVALIAAYALSVNYDWMIATIVDSTAKSWLSGQSVHISFGLAVGQFLRPGLAIFIVWALALDSVTLSILAHRRSRPSVGMLPVEESCIA